MSADSMLGRLFALCDAYEQGDFLNAAGKTLRRACDDSTHADIQLCRIVDRLDGNGRDLIKRLASFIEIDETEPRVERRIVYVDVPVERPIEAAEEP